MLEISGTTDLANRVDWITDREMSEQLLDVSPVPMIVTAVQDDAVLAVSSRATELLGVSMAVAGRVTDYCVDPTEYNKFTSVVRDSRRADDMLLRLRRSDGTPVGVLTYGRPISWDGEPAILCAFVDFTRHMDAAEPRSTP